MVVKVFENLFFSSSFRFLYSLRLMIYYIIFLDVCQEILKIFFDFVPEFYIKFD